MVKDTLEVLRVANRKRHKKVYCKGKPPWRPTDWGCALAGEAGELCNLLKKAQLRGKKVKRLEIAYELADVLHYTIMAADFLGIDLDAAARHKFNLVSRRIGSDIKVPLKRLPSGPLVAACEEDYL